MYKIHSKYLNLILSNSEPEPEIYKFLIYLIFGIFLIMFGLLILYPVITDCRSKLFDNNDSRKLVSY